MSESSARVQLGRITGHFGVRGWVKVHSDTQPRENIVQYKEWLLFPHGRSVAVAGDEVRKVQVIDGREQGKTVVARLEGIEDRDAAEQLIGYGIVVDRAALPGLDEDQYYWTDLIGMGVVTIENVRIGTVRRLFETGANDVLVISDERAGSKVGAEVLVPWIQPTVITRVDQDARQITVDWDPDF